MLAFSPILLPPYAVLEGTEPHPGDTGYIFRRAFNTALACRGTTEVSRALGVGVSTLRGAGCILDCGLAEHHRLGLSPSASGCRGVSTDPMGKSESPGMFSSCCGECELKSWSLSLCDNVPTASRFPVSHTAANEISQEEVLNRLESSYLHQHPRHPRPSPSAFRSDICVSISRFGRPNAAQADLLPRAFQGGRWWTRALLFASERTAAFREQISCRALVFELVELRSEHARMPMLCEKVPSSSHGPRSPAVVCSGS